MRAEDLSQIEIATLSDLDRALNEAGPSFERTFALWRGHANIEWALRAEVFREKRYQEVTPVRSFMAHAESRRQPCPAEDDLVGWLMLARHFGLPTRLMDWSQSPLTALYFAAQRSITDESKPDTDGCLWALEPGRMNLQMAGNRRLFAPAERSVRAVLEIAFEPDPRVAARSTEPIAGKAYAIGPREIDARVLVQQGAFTIHAGAQDLADVGYYYAGHSQAPPWRRAFRVPRAAKPMVLHFLRELGVNESTLFPDLGALARELKARQFLGS